MPTCTLPLDYQPPAQMLKGRCALVTGAGDGLGKAIALACAAQGAEVILLDRVVRKLEAVYDAICEGGHREPAIYPMDLEGAQPTDYEEMADKLGESLGRLDILVHNAARLGTITPLEHYDLVEWAKVMQVNLNAPFLLTRACLPLLHATGDARVLFVSDQVAVAGRAYWGAYCASKFALEGFMQLLAQEQEADQRVFISSIDPGRVRTQMRATAYPAEEREGLRLPHEVAGAFLYALGPHGRELHGHRLEIPE